MKEKKYPLSEIGKGYFFTLILAFFTAILLTYFLLD